MEPQKNISKGKRLGMAFVIGFLAYFVLMVTAMTRDQLASWSGLVVTFLGILLFFVVTAISTVVLIVVRGPIAFQRAFVSLIVVVLGIPLYWWIGDSIANKAFEKKNERFNSVTQISDCTQFQNDIADWEYCLSKTMVAGNVDQKTICLTQAKNVTPGFDDDPTDQCERRFAGVSLTEWSLQQDIKKISSINGCSVFTSSVNDSLSWKYCVTHRLYTATDRTTCIQQGRALAQFDLGLQPESFCNQLSVTNK